MNYRQFVSPAESGALLAAFAVMLALSGCGGGGGGDRADGVVEGPPPPNTTPPPNPSVPSNSVSVDDIGEDTDVSAAVTGVTIASPPTVTFSLLVDGFRTVSDLTTDDFRATFAALQPGTEPESLIWQSYVVTSEDPVCRNQADIESSSNACITFTAETDPDGVPDSALKVQDPVAIGKLELNQATYERSGTLDGNDDGTWSYTLNADPGDAATLDNLHRVCFQFDFDTFAGNPCVDFIPSEVAASGDGETGTSLSPMFYDLNPSREVVTTDSCNSCHSDLAIHGGNRRDAQYCATCHNPDTTDANSTNSQDFPVLVHRIHYSASIPSVADGTPYKIWGFRNGEHDYSDVSYPQRAANCTRCHAGEEDVVAAAAKGLPAPRAEITPDGHNWSTKPSGPACASCHENNGHVNALEGRCTECHSAGGSAGSVADSHRDLIREAGLGYRYDILSVSRTGPGERPVIDFQVVDPENADAPYDILSDDPFIQPDGASRLAVTVSWSTTDYDNTGNAEEDASAVSIDALTEAENLGGNVFQVISPVAVPDGSLDPLVAAIGSGAITVEGHPAEEVDETVERIPVTAPVSYFSIDEPDGLASPRRDVADFELCASCHEELALHGDNRKDNLQMCVTCHNPRNTDREVREVALDPPTDGKDEESLDFKTMVHGIHAPAIRENPLEIVGFRGFTTYRYTEEAVQYPGRLADCTGCHADETYSLPLADGVLATTTDTGSDFEDPADDIVTSPETAACASCHDDSSAIAHMENNGGSFATSQAALDDGDVVEQCSVCHRAGAIADVAEVHGLE